MNVKCIYACEPASGLSGGTRDQGSYEDFQLTGIFMQYSSQKSEARLLSVNGLVIQSFVPALISCHTFIIFAADMACVILQQCDM